VPRAFQNWLWIILFCAMVAALGFEALTASQQIPTQHHDYGAETAQQGSEPSGAAIDQSHSSKEASNRKQKQAQAAHHLKEFSVEFFNLKLSDAIIAIFTIVLAYKTSGLFKETAGLREAAAEQSGDMKKSIVAAQLAANAAMTQAATAERAFTLLERPRVLLAGISSIGQWTNPFDQDQGTITFDIGNYGKIPAIVHHVMARCTMIELPLTPEKLAAPNIPLGQDHVQIWRDPLALSQGETRTMPTFAIQEQIAVERLGLGDDGKIIYRPVAIPQNSFFLSIAIRYEDAASGVVRDAHTLWCGDSGSFVRWGGKAYNYEEEVG
jgi:hypothetical protein